MHVGDPTTVKVVIVANGDVDPDALRAAMAVPAGGGPRPMLICADGGAHHALAAGVLPDLVVGDGDSLAHGDAADLRERGVPVRLVSPEKDESDTQLCVLEAVALGADEVVMLGALGGPRPEHALANVGLLALAELQGLPMAIHHGRSSLRLVGVPGGPSECTIAGEAGDFVSLLPFGDGVEGVTSEGLRYPLDGEPLPVGPARGLSNELVGALGHVRVERGRVLVIHTRRDAEATA